MPPTIRGIRERFIMPIPSQTAKVACGCSTRIDTVDAVREAVEDVAAAMAGNTDLAVVFFSRDHLTRAGMIDSMLLDTLAPQHLVGMSATGVIANANEFDHVPGISVFALSCPDVEFHTFTEHDLDWPETKDDSERLSQIIKADSPDLRGIMLFADPFVPLLRLIPAISSCLSDSMDSPAVPLFGGVASAGSKPGTNRLLRNDEIRIGGIVGLSIRGAMRIDALVSQGCHPIGRPLIVTKANRNIIESLGGRPALQAIQEMAHQISQRDRELMQQGLFVGRVVNEYRDRFGRGDFLIRNVVGVDPKHEVIAVNDIMRVGQTIQFQVRDAATATEDLELLLAAQQLDDPPLGGILFSCTGRGLNMFDEPNKDASTIRRSLPGLPLAGCFAAGEIGPVGNEAFVHGQTAALALFRCM